MDEGGARLERANLIYKFALDQKIQVQFVTSKFNHFTKKYRKINHEKVVTLWTTPYKNNISILRFLNHFVLGINFFLFLIKERDRTDTILVSFPPIETAFFSVLFGKLFSKKVMIDVRDRWPELIEENSKSRLIKSLSRIYKLPRNYAVRNCYKLISTSPEFLQNIIEVAGVDTDKVTACALNMSYQLGCVPTSSERPRCGPLRICFAGFFALQNANALREFVEIFMMTTRKDVELILCGDGPSKHAMEIKTASDQRIKFKGFLNADDLHEILRSSHYGLLPYKPTSHFEFSYPNKFGEYLAFGLPILTSLDKGAVANVIRSEECGFTFSYENKKHFFNLIEKLTIAKALQMEKQCKLVFEKKFDAEKNYRNFVKEHLF